MLMKEVPQKFPREVHHCLYKQPQTLFWWVLKFLHIELLRNLNEFTGWLIWASDMITID